MDPESRVFKAGPPRPLAEYRDSVKTLLEASIAPNTRRAYLSRLRQYQDWCRDSGLTALPASEETIALYIAALSRVPASVPTLKQTLAAIRLLHESAGYPSPCQGSLIQKAVRGYKHTLGRPPQRPEAATADVVRLLIDAVQKIPASPEKRIRDAALLALGFAGAFRRSELTALNVEDLQWTLRNGQEILLIQLRRSKTDPSGRGVVKAIFPSEDKPHAPLRLIRQWLLLLNEREGSLFRRILRNGTVTPGRLSDCSIRLIIRQAAQAAGLTMRLSPHSLRSGFVTTAIRAGKSERSIMNQTGHRSASVMREYYRREDAVEDNAARGVL